MENPNPASSEKEDLQSHSTKKVKMDGNPYDSMADHPQPEVKTVSNPSGKPSHKDMVASSEFMIENLEDMVRAVTENLFPDLDAFDYDLPNSEVFNPNPEVLISHEEDENWCNPWRDTAKSGSSI
ncbi:hypothetical protein SESBI_15252 [Sesbania bispinosa]|nr:hypothetical protein SESBI_15252 [Sesbania bispinosa]